MSKSSTDSDRFALAFSDQEWVRLEMAWRKLFKDAPVDTTQLKKDIVIAYELYALEFAGEGA